MAVDGALRTMLEARSVAVVGASPKPLTPGNYMVEQLDAGGFTGEVAAVNPKYEALGELSVTLDDIKRFRQLGSRCPGHPEYRWTSGVETTTGPLGQGLANAVGMALAEKLLAATYAKLSPWQKTLVARHPDRPKALDYVRYRLTDTIGTVGASSIVSRSAKPRARFTHRSKSGAVTLKSVQAIAIGAKITRTPIMIFAAEITMIDTVAMRAATRNIRRPARAPVM